MNHVCNICNKVYKSYKSLWNHNRKYHVVNCCQNVVNEIVKEFECKYCKKVLYCCFWSGVGLMGYPYATLCTANHICGPHIFVIKPLFILDIFLYIYYFPPHQHNHLYENLGCQSKYRS